MKRSIVNIFNKQLKTLDINEINKIKVDLRELTSQNIKFILKKKPNDRSNEDIAFLKNFCLLKSRFIDKLNKEHIDEFTQDIIALLSMSNAFYTIIDQKDKIIYDIKEQSKYFYIILNGKVGVYDIEKIDCQMSVEEYYKLIFNYRNNKEKYLLERTLRENKVNIPIEITDVNKLDKIILKIYLLSKKNLKLYKENNTNYLNIIFNKLGFKYSDFGIQSYEEYLEQKNNEKKDKKEKLLTYNIEEAKKLSRENEDNVLGQINLDIPDSLCKKYLFLIYTQELSISYYRYKEKTILNDFDYFGDYFYGEYNNRVMSKTNNLELLCFNNNIYNDYLINLRIKYANTQDQFLLNNFFMSSIPKSTFEKTYINYFEYKKFYANQIIIQENDPINYIYFVKSGNIKVYSNRSIIQNHLLIQLIINIMKQKCPNISHENPDFNAYSEMKADFNKIKEEMSINKDIHIMNFQSKQCIGYECFYFGFNSLYTAIAFSEKVEVYRLSTENLYKILSLKNKKALYEFAIQAEKALKILLDQLIIVNNMLVATYLKKNKDVLKEASDFMEKAIILNQQKKEEMKGNANMKYSLVKEQKKIKEINYNEYNINNNYNRKRQNSLIFAKRKNSLINLKSNIKFNRNKLLEDMENTKNKIKQFNNFGTKMKLFDYKENLNKQRRRELLRESIELGKLSAKENRKINYLKLQNRISSDFIRFSKGENRIFINSKFNSMNVSSIRHHYCFKKRNIFINSKKNKLKSLSLPENLKKREYISKLNIGNDKDNLDTISDMIICSKFFKLDDNISSNEDKDKDKEKNKKTTVNVFKKSNDGQGIYKKYVINN